MRNDIYISTRGTQTGAVLRMLLVMLALALLLLGAGWGYMNWYARQPVPFSDAIKGARAEFVVPAGASGNRVAQSLAQNGILVNPRLAGWWFRLSGAHIKAGSYEIPRGSSLAAITKKLQEGAETLRSITVPEGYSLKQVRELLRQKDWLRQDSAQMSQAQLLAALKMPAVPVLEGYLAPDTYLLAKGASDLTFYRQAAQKMQRNIQAAWAARTKDSVLKTPADLVTLASIVEKETGHHADRTRISAVFHNRLKIGMRLQTDPTVIYGMGDSYQGNIRKKDLQTDTPWNTYTRSGLPPTPIAMPGKDALMAAAQPAQTDALYFVARGDGTGLSHFSNSLDGHNAAVREYILNR